MSETQSSSAEPLTLRQAYRQAQEKLKQLHATSTTTESTTIDDMTARYTQALSSLLHLQSLCSHSSLFSSNESLSDLPTSSLPFLTTDYYVGSVWSEWPGVDARRKRVDRSIKSFMSFLSLCDQYELFTPEENKLYQPVKAAVYGTDGNDDSSGHGKKKQDPAQHRMEKIMRHKLQKELQNKINLFEQTRSQSQESKRKGKSSSSTVGGDAAVDDDDDDSLDVDDETLREYWMNRLHLSIMSALDQIPLGLQEMEFLKHRESLEATTAQSATATTNTQTERAQQQMQQTTERTHQPAIYTISDPSQLNQPIPAHMTQYLQRIAPPSTPVVQAPPAASASYQQSTFDMSALVSSLPGTRPTRETVFRDPNPATMSVEEWADQEMKAGRLPAPVHHRPVAVHKLNYIGTRAEDREEEEEEAAVGEYGGEADMEKADAKAVADRGWDNWKDEHEKGAGNRMK